MKLQVGVQTIFAYSNFDRTSDVYNVINVLCVPKEGANLLIKPNVFLALAVLNAESSKRFSFEFNTKPRSFNVQLTRRSSNSPYKLNFLILKLSSSYILSG